jgi:hypothetical protein
MTEDEILAAALRITDPAERSRFIERSCGGDAALAARIATLLVAAAEWASGLVNESILKTGWGALPPSGASTGQAWAVVEPNG